MLQFITIDCILYNLLTHQTQIGLFYCNGKIGKIAFIISIRKVMLTAEEIKFSVSHFDIHLSVF